MEVVLPIDRRGVTPVAVVAWTSCVLVIILTGYAVTGAPRDPYVLSAVSTGLFGSVFAVVLLTRQPRHRIGWLFLIIGLSRGLAGAAQVWTVSALVTYPGRPGGDVASWLQLWTPAVGLALAPMIIILFPDGRLPGRGWWIVPALSGVALALIAIVTPIGVWRYRGVRLLPSAPVPDEPAARTVNTLLDLGLLLVAGAAVAALAGMLVRARRTRGDVRQQIKWFGVGVVCAFVLNVLATEFDQPWLIPIGVAATFVGIGLGIFRFRLYDVDRLIRRTLLYSVVTVALAAAFAALDVTAALVAGRNSPATVALSAFVVALLLRPVRDRAQNVVDRLYDRGAYSGVRLLRGLGQRVGQDTVGPDDVRDALRIALHDPELDVYYQTRTGTVVAGDGDPAELTRVADGRSVTPVHRAGGSVAYLAHGPVDPTYLSAVVPAAATALEHARLQAELGVQVMALRASRGRIVAAGDVERRRIERDLHDGAQQRLVGLAVHIQSARRGAAHPSDVDELLTFTVEQLQAGVAEIRALVYGILPSALVSGGLPAALAELPDVAVDCALDRRIEPDIESAAWFAISEGVANAHKHAPGAPVTVRVQIRNPWLYVEVCDRGPGGARVDGDGLRSLGDRIEAHGGRLRIDSPSGRGTRLVVELPCG